MAAYVAEQWGSDDLGTGVAMTGDMMAGVGMSLRVAIEVMGYTKRTAGIGKKDSAFPGRCLIRNHPEASWEYDRWSIFEPATNRVDAFAVVDKLAPLVGDFKSGDGFFHLIYADSAEHSQGGGCAPKRIIENANDDDIDHERWSAHFHIGIIGAGGGCPKRWDHGDKYCARGGTMEEAICRAALMAVKGKRRKKRALGVVGRGE